FLIATFSLTAALTKAIRFLLELARKHRLDKDLHPFFSYRGVRELKQYFIKTRLLTFTPSDFQELTDAVRLMNPKNSITYRQFFKDLTNQERQERFYFILGESGLGKTTFLVNLFLSYSRQL